MSKIISFWSIKKNVGISDISLCYSMEFANRFPEKKILWFTTNPFFCPLSKNLDFGDYTNTIDSLTEYLKEDTENNEKFILEAVTNVKGLENLNVLLEPSSKNLDYLANNVKKFEKIVLPALKELFDIIIIDTSSFIRSPISKILFKNSDLLANILIQNAALIDGYLMYKEELKNNTKAKINILNRFREDIQPGEDAVRDILNEEIHLIHDDIYFTSASNTGNLFNYYLDQSIIAKDIKNSMDNICSILEIKQNEKVTSVQDEKKSFLSKIFKR